MEQETKNWQDVDKTWDFYYREGESYLKTCQSLLKDKKTFDNEFIYNLAVLAGERLVLGLLLSYNYIPSATSLSGMIQEGKQFYKYDESLLTGARFINKFQFFCSLEVVPLTVPNDEEISKLVGYMEDIEVFSRNNLNKEVISIIQ